MGDNRVNCSMPIVSSTIHMVGYLHRILPGLSADHTSITIIQKRPAFTVTICFSLCPSCYGG